MIELSVVIPSFNRRHLLAATLASLGEQSCDFQRFEVVVVVDGSTDGTAEMLATFAAPYAVRVQAQPNAGAGAARNRGAGNARGAVCLFLDDDMVVSPTLIEEHLAAHARNERVVVLGRIDLRMSEAQDAYARWFADWWRDHYARLAARPTHPTYRDCYGGNFSVSRAEFTAAGGFAEDLARLDDFELGYRLQARGLSFVYVDGAVSEQSYPGGYARISSDNFKAGSSAVELFRRHPPILLEMPLGNFNSAAAWSVQLRRLLLASRVPPRLMRLLDLVARGRAGWYPFLTTYDYWRGVQAVAEKDMWRRLTRGARIVMYHAVATAGESPSRYVVAPRALRRQLDFLVRSRRPVLALHDLLEYRLEHRLPPAGSVVITFDDGYVDAASVAVPMLEERSLPATFFLVGEAMGDANSWDTSGPLSGRRILGWDEARSLLTRGITFGGHTITHPNLPSVSAAEARAEVEGSKRALLAELGESPRAFSYPFGADSDQLRTLVEESGFDAACLARHGVNDPNTNRFALRRVEVEGGSSLLRFVLGLWLGDPRPDRHLKLRFGNAWRRFASR